VLLRAFSRGTTGGGKKEARRRAKTAAVPAAVVANATSGQPRFLYRIASKVRRRAGGMRGSAPGMAARAAETRLPATCASHGAARAGGALRGNASARCHYLQQPRATTPSIMAALKASETACRFRGRDAWDVTVDGRFSSTMNVYYVCIVAARSAHQQHPSCCPLPRGDHCARLPAFAASQRARLPRGTATARAKLGRRVGFACRARAGALGPGIGAAAALWLCRTPDALRIPALRGIASVGCGATGRRLNDARTVACGGTLLRMRLFRDGVWALA